MDVRNLILEELARKGEVRGSDITGRTGFSRVYVNRFFRMLRDEGKIVLVGKANRARYVAAPGDGLPHDSDRNGVVRVHRVLRNDNLREDIVLDQIREEGDIFGGLALNVVEIITYAFTEMLNNAIEHSGSSTIDVLVRKTGERLSFDVSDRGVGIFRNIMRKEHLKSSLEAIQDLLKGKETTAPAFHSGEGIFFTSKVADLFKIRSFEKKLVFDNAIQDIYVGDLKRPVHGTKVFFSITIASQRALADVFRRFTDGSLEFSRTNVRVKLFRSGVEYVSRSQARRIVAGLEKFKTVEMDFKGITTIGQGFTDEIFRVWHLRHPDIEIIPLNTVDNVDFMVRHVAPSPNQSKGHAKI